MTCKHKGIFNLLEMKSNLFERVHGFTLKDTGDQLKFSEVRAQLPAATTWRTTIMLLLMQKPVHG